MQNVGSNYGKQPFQKKQGVRRAFMDAAIELLIGTELEHRHCFNSQANDMFIVTLFTNRKCQVVAKQLN